MSPALFLIGLGIFILVIAFLIPKLVGDGK